MRAAWLALLAAPACAEISGLSELNADGGNDATNDVVTQDVAQGDGAPDVSDSGDAGDAGPFCLAQKVPAKTTFFCSDFDEQDIRTAYVNGLQTAWTSPTSLPTFDKTLFQSSPASGNFTSNQVLVYLLGTLQAKGTKATLSAAVDITTPADMTVDILFLTLDAAHTVVVVANRAGPGIFTWGVNELLNTDAGTVVAAHTTPTGAKGGEWHQVLVTADPSTITLAVDSTQIGSWGRTFPSDITQPAFSVAALSNTAWTCDVDNLIGIIAQ